MSLESVMLSTISSSFASNLSQHHGIKYDNKQCNKNKNHCKLFTRSVNITFFQMRRPRLRGSHSSPGTTSGQRAELGFHPVSVHRSEVLARPCPDYDGHELCARLQREPFICMSPGLQRVGSNITVLNL